MNKKPVAIIILDGMGCRKEVMGNAVAQAKKPNFDCYMNEFPNATMQASGLPVGLPEGQMGNSEVGHTNIGAGRIVYQSLTRIDKAIQDGEFLTNPALSSAYEHAIKNNSSLHLFGLLSDGGVHSHINHIIALIRSAKQKGIKKLYFHAFLDGRDVDPHAAPNYIRTVEAVMKEEGLGEIATVSGRYYAMDRDKRWERIELAYNAIAHGEGEKFESAQQVVEHSYANEITDEFVLPSVIEKNGKPVATIEDNDSIIFFNFRPDRAIQLSNAFTNEEWEFFDRGTRPQNVKFVTMTLYQESVIADVAFAPIPLKNVVAEVLSKEGLKQLHIAETEKYPHVTFFFSGGREEQFVGESRILCPSPKEVPTYDFKPEMSAFDITEKILPEIENESADFICLNFANTDMVGHTGVFSAAVKAAEVVDECISRVATLAYEHDYAVFILADHGNSDVMMNPDGSPNTQHSTNLVPLIVMDKDRTWTLKPGKLGDVAPSILKVMGIEIPAVITGDVLVS